MGAGLMRRLDLKSIRSDLGGAGFLDRKIYLALSPLFFFNSVLISRHEPSLENWMWLAISNVIALTICWGWLEFAARVIFSNRAQKPAAIHQVILFALSIGALKGFATGVAAFAIGFEPNLAESINTRLLQTALNGVMVVLGASAIAAAQNRYQNERDLLIAERVQELTSSPKFAELNSEIAQELRTFVSKAKEQLRKQTGPASQVIMDIVEQGLRPLSHKLWERENTKFANYAPGELVRITLLNKKYFAWPTAAFYAVITIPPAWLYKGPTDALLRTLLGAVIIAAIFSLGRLIATKSLAAAIGVYLATLVATTVGIMTLSTYLLGELPIADPLSVAIAVFIWFVEVTLVLGMARVMRENHREVRRDLLRLLGSKNIQSDIATSSNFLLYRELANYLHGSVQNQLISAALKIERNGDNPQVMLRELAEVERLLDSTDNFSSIANGGSLVEQLELLKSNWAGFVEIEIAVPDALKLLPAVLENQLAQVANEAISNAVRHGHAKSALIRITQTAEHIEISVTDDGLGPIDNKPGLGSKFFDVVAPGGWSLKPNSNGGSIFTLGREVK